MANARNRPQQAGRWPDALVPPRLADSKIAETYQYIPFRPVQWRKGENLPKVQGLVLGCEGKKNAVSALVDSSIVDSPAASAACHDQDTAPVIIAQAIIVAAIPQFPISCGHMGGTPATCAILLAAGIVTSPPAAVHAR